MKWMGSLLGRSRQRVVILWRDPKGKRRSAYARLLDHSGSDALIRSGARIDAGSLVRVRSLGPGLRGSARVSHCLPGIFTYRIALQIFR
jgi:hypothetical protein